MSLSTGQKGSVSAKQATGKDLRLATCDGNPASANANKCTNPNKGSHHKKPDNRKVLEPIRNPTQAKKPVKNTDSSTGNSESIHASANSICIN